MTYSIAFAFMTSEKEDNFVRALERCRDMLKCQDNPEVVVTNRDLALMNAIDRVFLKSTVLLCRFHITIKHALTPVRIGPAHEDKWLMIPDMCFLLAQKYKHVVVCLPTTKAKLLLPPTSLMWAKHHLQNATNWSYKYLERMSNYNNITRAQGGIIIRDYDAHEKIVVDLEDNIVPETVDLTED
ncbi:protein FAR1-RELATED SEQUENCE 6-like [Trifolium medium]|uniref:Protein FAR1-RELATED SEQUENCE 6-like n=1 Tax=Trifolium medium TaxID=97028 RepID=A0A392M705_9FABA|nr:protein FAR1-RELATED SEQUENCE 6-like [Trifolium medium]